MSPISTIGFGFTLVSSDRRLPKPPAKITTFRMGITDFRMLGGKEKKIKRKALDVGQLSSPSKHMTQYN
ncbi:MAG: hypothetical protein H7251_12020 [Acetobacteraceae bacterium]|nr:hypothetical protein [Acetobacteraceae bacterium]